MLSEQEISSMSAITEAVAKELGGTHEVDKEFYSFYALISIPGLPLKISAQILSPNQLEKNRFKFYASFDVVDAYGKKLHWVDCVPYNERERSLRSLSISVSAENEPAKIARDIQRRLIPQALDIYALMQKRITETQGHYDAQVRAKEEFTEECKALGMDVIWRNDNEFSAAIHDVFAGFYAYPYNGDEPKITIDLRSATVSAKDAAVIAEILKRNKVWL